MTIPISQNWTGRRGHLNSNSVKAKNDRLVLTFLLGTVRGVPCLRMPPSICTPNTMGSRVLNIQLGKIFSLHGKTAISLCCSLNLCFRSCNRVGHEMTKFLYTTTSCTLPLPVHYHYLYTITSHTLPPQCRPYLPVLHKVVKEVVDNVCSEYLHPQLVSVLLCLPLHTDIKG